MEIYEDSLLKHQRTYKIIKRIKQYYEFSGIRNVIAEVIKECNLYYKIKVIKHKLYGELKPASLKNRIWKSFSMNMIIKLSKSENPVTGLMYDSILVIIE
jgi:hypothetical protein